MTNVLFLGCHADDIELGCGGTIHKNRQKWNIRCVTLSSSSYSPQGEQGEYPDIWLSQKRALTLLGVTDMMWLRHRTNFFYEARNDVWASLHQLKLDFKPEIVFTQATDDHQDHCVLSEETSRVFQSSTIIEYHIPRSQRNFIANYYETLEVENVNAKVKALDEYDMYRYKSYVQADFLRSQMVYNGGYVGAEYAEAFRIIQMIDL